MEELIHRRIDADLRHKSLLISGNIDADDPDSGFTYVTTQAADELRKALRPYIEYVKNNNSGGRASLEDLAAEYLRIFGPQDDQ